uniref:CD300c molecule n=1 Tax=Molossus molossus TaxID=27622 RepID=A0A7J8CWH7_MOLMO|nr:CD300c molecule [Molossus molossus]
MSPGDGATWLPLVLFLLQVSGCLSLNCTRRVTGTVGGSLSVQCRYKGKFTDMKKYWCKSPCKSLMKMMVETTETQRAVRSGRVSLRDHPENLTFTVTLGNLSEGDAGTYWCGIQRPQRERLADLSFSVVVSVSPAPTLKICTSTLGPPSSLPVTTRLNVTGQETPDHGQHPRSLLSSVHFLLLVFLKVPLLLGMLSAVVWVNRPLRSSGRRWSRPHDSL